MGRKDPVIWATARFFGLLTALLPHVRWTRNSLIKIFQKLRRCMASEPRRSCGPRNWASIAVGESRLLQLANLAHGEQRGECRRTHRLLPVAPL